VTSAGPRDQAVAEAASHTLRDAYPPSPQHHSASAPSPWHHSASAPSPTASSGQPAPKAQPSSGVPDLLTSAQEILGCSSGPWPCRPVARRLFPAPTSPPIASLFTPSHEGCRGPAGPSLAARTCTAGASLAVQRQTGTEGMGAGLPTGAASPAAEERHDRSDTVEVEDAKAAGPTSLLFAEPSSSTSPSPPPSLASPASEEGLEAPAASEAQECTQDFATESHTGMGTIVGNPQQEEQPCSPAQGPLLAPVPAPEPQLPPSPLHPSHASACDAMPRVP